MEKIIPAPAPTVSSAAKLVELPDDQMNVIFEGMREYIGVHKPVFDVFGEIIDCHLVKWNPAYSAVRNKVVEHGQSLVQTYFEPLDALKYVNRAWKEGSCEQVFFIGDDVHDKYRTAGEIVYITVVWQRVGEFILEMGNDLSDFKKIQMKLHDQEIAVLEAENVAAVVEERERIGREMHDSIIQQLYAASLTLQTVSTVDPQSDTSRQLSLVAELIDKTISEIRHQIMSGDNSSIVDARSEIYDIATSMISGSKALITVEVEAGITISAVIAPHFRSVIKEATSNAIRHGHAVHIAYSCIRIDGELRVVITDDGQGFSHDVLLGHGLINMRHRAELLGGTLEIVKNVPRGTRIQWTVPETNHKVFS